MPVTTPIDALAAGADMNANLACNLLEAARRGSDRPALRLGDAVVSYGALDDASARADRRRRAAGGRRHGGDSLHIGDDRDAEGRRADTREPLAQRGRRAGALRAA